MKYELEVQGVRTHASNGVELDSFVREAATWGVKPEDIKITVLEITVPVDNG